MDRIGTDAFMRNLDRGEREWQNVAPIVRVAIRSLHDLVVGLDKRCRSLSRQLKSSQQKLASEEEAHEEEIRKLRRLILSQKKSRTLAPVGAWKRQTTEALSDLSSRMSALESELSKKCSRSDLTHKLDRRAFSKHIERIQQVSEKRLSDLSTSLRSEVSSVVDTVSVHVLPKLKMVDDRQTVFSGQLLDLKKVQRRRKTKRRNDRGAGRASVGRGRESRDRQPREQQVVRNAQCLDSLTSEFSALKFDLSKKVELAEVSGVIEKQVRSLQQVIIPPLVDVVKSRMSSWISEQFVSSADFEANSESMVAEVSRLRDSLVGLEEKLREKAEEACVEDSTALLQNRIDEIEGRMREGLRDVENACTGLDERIESSAKEIDVLQAEHEETVSRSEYLRELVQLKNMILEKLTELRTHQLRADRDHRKRLKRADGRFVSVEDFSRQTKQLHRGVKAALQKRTTLEEVRQECMSVLAAELEKTSFVTKEDVMQHFEQRIGKLRDGFENAEQAIRQLLILQAAPEKPRSRRREVSFERQALPRGRPREPNLDIPMSRSRRELYVDPRGSDDEDVAL